ncbi:hypothetical protein [Chryseobacterium bernardetii]|uniref:hypothetical protein n=1 Tax=Chryseobacterium bernardetii TaxID=1241978 RepID=UPI001625A92D|nr:hypothetical protein [Chryseobacterium bernardetii]
MQFFINYFTAVQYQKKVFRYKVAVGIINKRLREAISINSKPMTQIYLNNDIKDKYNIDWNSAREESLPNTTLQNVFLICDYFKIDISKYFEIVKNVSDEEVDIAINSKKKLTRLYSIYLKY